MRAGGLRSPQDWRGRICGEGTSGPFLQGQSRSDYAGAEGTGLAAGGRWGPAVRAPAYRSPWGNWGPKNSAAGVRTAGPGGFGGPAPQTGTQGCGPQRPEHAWRGSASTLSPVSAFRRSLFALANPAGTAVRHRRRGPAADRDGRRTAGTEANARERRPEVRTGRDGDGGGRPEGRAPKGGAKTTNTRETAREERSDDRDAHDDTPEDAGQQGQRMRGPSLRVGRRWRGSSGLDPSVWT